MSTTVTGGVYQVADWSTFTFSPSGAEDLITTPGSIGLATGYQTVVATSPDLDFSGWSQWMTLLATCSQPDQTAVLFRFKCATTEGGLAAASWSAYFAIGDDGKLQESLLAYGKNNTGFSAGPWAVLEVSLYR